MEPLLRSSEVYAESVDLLIQKAVKHVLLNGIEVNSRVGWCRQTYNTSYVLLDSTQILHTLRAPASTKYLARELLAYFKGSLRVSDGLSHASKFWDKLKDSDGNINSNYGYYIFHLKVPGKNGIGISQFQWVLDSLIKDPNTRQAYININDAQHKTDTLDFPCTIGLQFLILNDRLHCHVTSRSTDLYTGLPYDMAFFALINQLVHGNLIQTYPVLKLGQTTMSTMFSHIYDKSSEIMKAVSEMEVTTPDNKLVVPMEECQTVVSDIINNCNKNKFTEKLYTLSI